MHTPYCRTTKFDVVTAMGRGLFLGVNHAQPQGAESQHSSVLRFTSVYANSFCCRTTNFDVVTAVGVGLYLGVNRASDPKRAQFQGSPSLGVLLVHSLTQNDQIWYGNICGKGDVFTRSATSLHLHKSVKQFVSDS